VDVDPLVGPSVDRLIGGRIVVRSDGAEVVDDDNEGPRVVILICDVVVPLVDRVVDGRIVVINAREVVDDDGPGVDDVLVCDVVVLLVDRVVGGRIVVINAREVVNDDGPRVDNVLVCDVVVLLVVVETELGRRVDKMFGRLDVSCRVVVVVVVLGVFVLLLLLPTDGLLVDSSPGFSPSVGMRVGMTVGMISVGIPVGITLKIPVGITLGSGDEKPVCRGDGNGDPLRGTGLPNPVVAVVIGSETLLTSLLTSFCT
jgi:hypothetical protein